MIRPRAPFHYTPEQKIEFYSERVGSCLLWSVCKEGNYPSIKTNKRRIRVSVYVPSKKLGRPLAAGKQALHVCDNPRCVEEDHLFEGAPLDNARDRKNKGRNGNLKGTNNGRAKLTETMVKRIRHAMDKHVPHSKLSSEYGVSMGLLSMIRNRQVWSHV